MVAAPTAASMGIVVVVAAVIIVVAAPRPGEAVLLVALATSVVPRLATRVTPSLSFAARLSPTAIALVCRHLGRLRKACREARPCIRRRPIDEAITPHIRPPDWGEGRRVGHSTRKIRSRGRVILHEANVEEHLISEPCCQRSCSSRSRVTTNTDGEAEDLSDGQRVNTSHTH